MSNVVEKCVQEVVVCRKRSGGPGIISSVKGKFPRLLITAAYVSIFVKVWDVSKGVARAIKKFYQVNKSQTVLWTSKVTTTYNKKWLRFVDVQIALKLCAIRQQYLICCLIFNRAKSLPSPFVYHENAAPQISFHFLYLLENSSVVVVEILLGIVVAKDRFFPLLIFPLMLLDVSIHFFPAKRQCFSRACCVETFKKRIVCPNRS